MTTLNRLQHIQINWLMLLCNLIFMPIYAHADESIQTELLHGFAFSSEAEAVRAMKEHCLADSRRENAEHVGAILQSADGSFLVTHGQANSGQSSVTFKIRHPPASRIVALWHTHGAPGRSTERFSITDGQTVRQIGLPFYLITPKGDIKVLEKVAKEQSRAQANFETDSERTYVRKFKGLHLFQLI